MGTIDHYGTDLGAVGRGRHLRWRDRPDRHSNSAFLYTRKSVRATATNYLKDTVNNWNAFAISTPEHVKALEELRAPVLIGHPKDSIVFSYINYLHITFVMRTEGLISPDTEKKALRNGIEWLRGVGRDKMEQYLSRGYDSPFRARILAEYDNLPI